MTSTASAGFAPGPIHRFLADDHARLDGLLTRATADAAHVDRDDYAAFRAGLLKHIGMEEKILLPAVRQARGGEPLPVAATLRLEHGAIAALLVPSPTAAVVHALRTILAAHNRIEEGAQGLYADCERVLGADAAAVLARLREAPEVPVNAHVDSQLVMDAARRALARAGYDDLI